MPEELLHHATSWKAPSTLLMDGAGADAAHDRDGGGLPSSSAAAVVGLEKRRAALLEREGALHHWALQLQLHAAKLAGFEKAMLQQQVGGCLVWTSHGCQVWMSHGCLVWMSHGCDEAMLRQVRGVAAVVIFARCVCMSHGSSGQPVDYNPQSLNLK